MSDYLQPHGLQQVRLPSPPLSRRVCTNSYPLSWWCYLTISSSITSYYSCPQCFPASGSFPMSQLLAPGGSNYWSFSFSINPSNAYSRLISCRIDCFDLLAFQGTLKSLLQHCSLETSIHLYSVLFIVQLSHSCVATGKTIAILTFVSTVLSLLFNTLSRLVIAFLQNNKCLLISWLQLPSTVILETKKIKSATASTLSLSREESEKVDLKRNIQKTKIIASGPITSRKIDGERVADFIFWAQKSLQMVIAAMKLKDAYSLERKLWPI